MTGSPQELLPESICNQEKKLLVHLQGDQELLSQELELYGAFVPEEFGSDPSLQVTFLQMKRLEQQDIKSVFMREICCSFVMSKLKCYLAIVHPQKQVWQLVQTLQASDSHHFLENICGYLDHGQLNERKFVTFFFT